MSTPNQFFKAVRQDGTDFYTGTVQWAPPVGHDGPWEVRHPTSAHIYKDDDWTDYVSCLCLSDAPADCVGFGWPARLLVVEAPDAVHDHGHKWVTLTARVVGERPGHEVFGPQGEHVVALLDALRGMTPEQETAALGAARDAAWYVAWYVAWDAARGAARGAARDAAWCVAGYVAGDAACALVVRDLISTEHYDALTRPLRLAGITVHPDDPELPA